MTPNEIAKLLSPNIRTQNGLIEAAFRSNVALELLTKPSVTNWIRQNGIPQYNPKNISHLGEGGIGHTFIYGDKVMKVTTDLQEALQVKRAVGLNHPNLATYHGAVQIGVVTDKFGSRRKVYLIILDFVDVKNVPPELKEAADLVGGFLDVTQQKPPYNLEECVSYIVNYNDVTNHTVQGYLMDLLNILNSLYKDFKLDYRDVGATNVGMVGDTIKLFDLGLSTFLPP
jgi:hypothetical protein